MSFRSSALRATLYAALFTATVNLAPPASAQSLLDIVHAVSSTSRNQNSSGINRVIRQIDRIATQQENASRQMRSYRQRRISEQRQDRSEYTNQLRRIHNSLYNACMAGDARSCERSGNKANHALFLALLDACNAGDTESCIRVEQSPAAGQRMP